MYYGIIGSGSYKNKEFINEILELFINLEHDVIVSGFSPRNNYNNVDIWAENWANKFCKNKPLIFYPKTILDLIKKNKFRRDYYYFIPNSEFYDRNKLIANKSNFIIAFIPRFRYRSGAWNTINFFSKQNNFSFKKIIIFNEFYRKWTFDEYPDWLRNREKKNNKINLDKWI